MLNRTIDALLGPESPSVYIEKLAAFWPWFWERIGAQGDYEAALAECSKRYNRGVPAKGETVRDEH